MMNNRQIWDNIFQFSQAVFRVTHLFPKDEILRRHIREGVTEILYQTSSANQRENPADLVKRFHDLRSLIFMSKNFNFVNEKNIAVLMKECENLINIFDNKQKETASVVSVAEDDLEKKKMFISDFARPETNRSLKRGIDEEILLKKMVAKKMKSKMGLLPAGAISEGNSLIGFSEIELNGRQHKLLNYFHKILDEKVRLKDIAGEFKNIPERTLRQDLRDLCESGKIGRNGFGPGSFYFAVKNKAE